jgi:hypothetical protein
MKSLLPRNPLSRPFFLRPLTALFVAVLYFLFHLHFMQQFIDWDSSAYLNNVWKALRSMDYLLFNPHHLHMEITGVWFQRWMAGTFGKLGLTDMLFNLELRSLISACIGMFFAVLYLWDVTGKAMWGLLGALLIGFSHGYLHYATKVDTGIFPVSMFLAILWILRRIETVKGRPVLLLSLVGGVFLFIGVMAHQYIVIACGLACFTAMLPPWVFPRGRPLAPFTVVRGNERRLPKPALDGRPGLRYASFAILAVAGAILVIGAYFYAGKSFYNLSFEKPTPEQSNGLYRYTTFQRWLWAYALEDSWGKGLTQFDPRAPIKGITDTFLQQTFLRQYYFGKFNFTYNMEKPFEEKAFVPNQLAFFMIFPLVGCVVFFPMLLKRYRRSFLFLFLCIPFYFVFFTYWEPTYFEFWILPGILLCIVAVMLLNVLSEKLSAVLGRISHLPAYAYIAFLLFLFASYNMLYYLVPYSRVRMDEGLNRIYTEAEYADVYAYPFYTHPDNVFKDVYDTTPGSYMPAGKE